MHSCLLRRFLFLITFFLAATISFTGCSKSSGSIPFFPSGGDEPDPLAAPLNVTATNGSYTDRVAIAWEAVTGATYYQVYRSETADGTYELVSGDETLLSYDDVPDLPDTPYYYKVKALNAETESELSGYATGKLGLDPIEVPENVTATDGTHTDRIVVSWDAVDNATFYKVYRSATSDGSYAEISGEETILSYEDTDITPATDYFYKVKAFNASQESDFSAYSTGAAGLAVPGSVSATDATYNDHVAVTWTAVAGAAYYRVYRAESATGEYTDISGENSAASYDDDDGSLSAGTDYYYKVKAFSGGWESELSAYDAGSLGEFIVPNPPANVAATQGTSETTVTITWDTSDGADMYALFRSATVDGTYEQLGTDTTGLTLDDETVTVGTHYFYKVKAHNGDGWSDFSAAAEGWAEEALLPLDAPANVSATERTSTSTVTVTWDAVSGATYYRVYRALKSDGDYAQVGGDLTGTSYSDTDTFEDLAYYYKVKAFDATRESAYSAYDLGRCDLTRLEYLLRYNINWEYMNSKLHFTTDFPPTGISGPFAFDINGTNGGSLAVDITLSITLIATTTFDVNNYDDLNMALDGTETMVCNTSGTGYRSSGRGFSGTITTTGSYTGTVVESLDIVSRVRTAGTFQVTYGGSTETINFSSTSGPGIIISAPAHISATQGAASGAVTISWAPVYGANKYRVYRATSSTGAYTQVGGDVTGSAVSADGTVCTYTDPTGNATHYFYKVMAVNDYLLNDLNGSSSHTSNETVISAYSAYSEGWGN